MGEIQVQDFNLRLTLESGQFFRYVEEHGSYLLLTKRRAIKLRQDGKRLQYGGASAGEVRTLLGLTGAHEAQVHELLKDPVIASIVSRYKGLRIMRQDLHETILGFICSSMSNIPKIRMNLRLIAEGCGEQVSEHYYLPSPGIALNYETVRAAKTGYRAKFIVQSNALLTKSLLSEIENANYDEAHRLLCTLPGVGPKVADCISLYALGHGEAFPVDVHILRAMKLLFPREKFANERQIKTFAQQRWGKNAGLAQQYIFEWARREVKRGA